MRKENEVQLNQIETALEHLEYGTIIITVHDKEITQIDTTTKKRFKLPGKKQRKTK